MSKLVKLVSIIVFIVLLSGCAEVMSSGEYTEYDERQAVLRTMLNNAEVTEGINYYGAEVELILTNDSDFYFDYIEIRYDVYDEDDVLLGNRFKNMDNVGPGQKFKIKLDSFKSGTAYYEITAITDDVFSK